MSHPMLVSSLVSALTLGAPLCIWEETVKWDTLALHSWASVGLCSEGINSAANRCFHLAYKHSTDMPHCILLPPCQSTTQPRSFFTRNAKVFLLLNTVLIQSERLERSWTLSEYPEIYPFKLWHLLLAIKLPCVSAGHTRSCCTAEADNQTPSHMQPVKKECAILASTLSERPHPQLKDFSH